MREKFNNLIKSIEALELYDWFLIFICVIILLILPKVFYHLNTLINKYFFGLERCKWIKGWKKIEK